MTPELSITRLDATTPDFSRKLNNLLAWDDSQDRDIHERVLAILNDVRRRGNQAVIEYTQRFDHCPISAPEQLELPRHALESAWRNLPSDQAQALQTAAERIRSYAEQQKMQSWQYQEADGTILGQKVTPLDRVGLYVPGG
ncbi:MAG: histidinol dehydrogenase, partial [Methylobacter sp.]